MNGKRGLHYEETDTWLIGFDGKTSKKLPKVISYRPAVNHVSVGYRGKFYVMGQTIGEASSYVFASMDADVTEPYGETAYQDEWVKGTYYGKDSFRNYDYPEKGRWRKNSNGWWYGDGKWFAKNQWQKIDGKWYYFDEKGYIVTGTRVIGGTEYRFDADGVYVGN